MPRAGCTPVTPAISTNDGTYTLAAWWPAAPGAAAWAAQARYEVVSGGVTVAVTNLDQRIDGDRWHTIATVALAATNQTLVRLSAAEGACVADAVHLQSAARYNDGQPAPRVRLQPMDGIVLRRTQTAAVRPQLRHVALASTNVVLEAAGLTPGVTAELQMAFALAPNSWSARSRFIPDTDGATLTEPMPSVAAYYRLVIP
jgi:hypothetical protein